MRDQVLDIWADLRDRRLWPVAAVLVLALVAVPVVLVKPAEEAPSQAATPAAAAGSTDPLAKQAVVKAFDSKPLVRISKLDQFSAKDPFKPLAQLELVDKTSVTKGGTTQSGSSGGGVTGGTPDSGLGGGLPGGGSPGGDIPGGTPGGGSPGGGDTKPQQKFTFTVDLTFVDRDDSKRYRDFDRLGMLPSESSPLLVFLGVDSTGTKAAFLVDASLQATEGEGACQPSPASCGVVYLEPGEEQSFKESDGHPYTLRIDQIQEKRIRAAAAAPRASTAEQPGRPARRFILPVLIDMEIGGQ